MLLCKYTIQNCQQLKTHRCRYQTNTLNPRSSLKLVFAESTALINSHCLILLPFAEGQCLPVVVGRKLLWLVVGQCLPVLDS